MDVSVGVVSQSTDGLRRGKAVHAGHLYVHQNGVVVVCSCRTEGRLALARFVHVVAIPAQDASDEHAARGIVFDQQNSKTGAAVGRGRW